MAHPLNETNGVRSVKYDLNKRKVTLLTKAFRNCPQFTNNYWDNLDLRTVRNTFDLLFQIIVDLLSYQVDSLLKPHFSLRSQWTTYATLSCLHNLYCF